MTAKTGAERGGLRVWDLPVRLFHWTLLAGLAALHVAAVLAHWLGKGENLILPMLTGHKPWPADRPRPALAFAPPLRALAMLALAAAAVLLLIRL
ncbi:hypothetical protein GALL_98070 [mine drainage metagenome]|uniref:Cytochrome b561 bacterial/Ni-hydrogenase domain-containing protein n=1 Tax=mine drainage metagenome TaxID=410659 RepID=A0A1J5SV58_9ZZZZ